MSNETYLELVKIHENIRKRLNRIKEVEIGQDAKYLVQALNELSQLQRGDDRNV